MPIFCKFLHYFNHPPNKDSMQNINQIYIKVSTNTQMFRILCKIQLLSSDVITIDSLSHLPPNYLFFTFLSKFPIWTDRLAKFSYWTVAEHNNINFCKFGRAHINISRDMNFWLMVVYWRYGWGSETFRHHCNGCSSINHLLHDTL